MLFWSIVNLRVLMELCGCLPLRFQAPVRDEESESQRKARSRLMRQSRRSTQVLATINHLFTSLTEDLKWIWSP